ncbi:MAG: hypothetical protein ACUVQW_04525 [Candidatus Bathycorpusculaceae bacterium]
MPILRKITTVGAARGITLPKDWLEWLHREHGVEIREVLLEIDSEIRVIPVIPKAQRSVK